MATDLNAGISQAHTISHGIPLEPAAEVVGAVEAPADAPVEDDAGEDVEGHTGHPAYAAGLGDPAEGAGLQVTNVL